MLTTLSKTALFAFVLLLASCSIAQAQNGFLRGKVIDGDMGDGLFSANVIKKGSTLGTTSDFDGNYSLSLPPGKHTIEFSFIAYGTKTVENVEIKTGEVTNLDITLEPQSENLQEVVITVEQAKNTEVALLTIKKKSINMVDGISSQNFRKVGDSDLGASIKRVTGVAIQGGKYVYVRGLGDRYTKTILNGMNIPGLDPDQNAVQMDIFPTNVLENVVVYKTFSPDLYGDFVGGLVDVQTKSFPTEKNTSVQVGLLYNPSMHLNSNYVDYKGGNFDFLGFDDGTRALPVDKNISIPDPVLGDPALRDITSSFNPVMDAMKTTSLMNLSLAANHGNQINKGDYTYGYNAVINYRNQTEYYDDFEIGGFLKDNDRSVNSLQPQTLVKGQLGTNDVMLSGLVSGALKFKGNSFNTVFLHTQNGISSASDRLNRDQEQNVATLVEDILTYTQRSITNNTTTGKHLFGDTELEWANSFSYSRIYDPDFRYTALSVRGEDTVLAQGDGARIDRFYRDLNEINESAKLDVKIPIKKMSRAYIKFGPQVSYKWRDFEVLNYQFNLAGTAQVPGYADWFFEERNIYDPVTEEGTYAIGNFEPANSFNAQQFIYAGYVMSEMPIVNRLRAIYGLRVEKTNMYYTGQNNSGTVVYEDSLTLDELNFLPSANLVYELNENMNLRLSYNRTLARPTFAEKSIAQIADPIQGRIYIGNINLEQTNIDNFDARWEWFFTPGEIASVSAFYKLFDGHIERVAFPTNPDNITVRNAGRSWVYGAEFELRKNFAFISERLKDLSLGGNLSVIRSFVDLNTVVVDASGKTELELRQEVSRDGETIDETRVMAGQSPYLINAYANYDYKPLKLSFNLSYNVQGESLVIIGSQRVPDVYAVPFNSLDFTASINLGEKDQWRIALRARNLLNDEREQVYRSFGTEDQIFSRYVPGVGVGVTVGYTF